MTAYTLEPSFRPLDTDEQLWLEGYSTGQMAEACGITYRKVDLLVRAGRIRPELAQSSGSGSHRRFAPWQIGELTEIIEGERTHQ